MKKLKSLLLIFMLCLIIYSGFTTHTIAKDIQSSSAYFDDYANSHIGLKVYKINGDRGIRLDDLKQLGLSNLYTPVQASDGYEYIPERLLLKDFVDSVHVRTGDISSDYGYLYFLDGDNISIEHNRILKNGISSLIGSISLVVASCFAAVSVSGITRGVYRC